jgi:hypothetical protein
MIAGADANEPGAVLCLAATEWASVGKTGTRLLVGGFVASFHEEMEA